MIKNMPETYVSTDIETDGPIPGPHSMLSIGSAAYDEAGNLIDTFSVNLFPLEGASPDPDTKAWWATQPEAWAVVNKDQKEPLTAMREYCEWVRQLPGRPVFVGYPAGFDFTFVYWYTVKFVKKCPFSFSAIDMKTMAMSILGLRFKDTTKKSMPKRWFPAELLGAIPTGR